MIAVALVAALVVAPAAAPGQEPRPALSRAEVEAIVADHLARNPEVVERIVKDYLQRQPEVLQSAIGEYVRRRNAGQGGTAQEKAAAVKANAELLFSSPRQVTLGNPQGDVVLVEFFDYNCGFCRRSAGDKLELMRADPKLKVVLKELPVLGPGSREAAQVAVAVRMQDASGSRYLAFHQAMMSARGQANRATAMKAAQEAGLDVARLERDHDSAEIAATIEESQKLAGLLGISGTPSYVVGQQVLIGAVGRAALEERIRQARR